jgi:hypothetical protein
MNSTQQANSAAPPPASVARLVNETLSIAAGFWAACLLLVSVEATVGWHLLVGVLFMFSIPTLVGFLTWAYRHLGLLLRMPQGLLSVLVLGFTVFTSASLIILVGLVAATNLKFLMTGA